MKNPVEGLIKLTSINQSDHATSINILVQVLEKKKSKFHLFPKGQQVQSHSYL